ncbi:MAG: hypothetical protein V5B33_08425 [Candidatus Accumulibacter sp. UW20]|jgi:hypothetical protein
MKHPPLDLTAQRAHTKALHAHSVATSPRSPQFSLRTFQDAIYAAGGLYGQGVSNEHATRLYRVLEVQYATHLLSLPQLIDHHAGNAWHDTQQWIGRGHGPDHAPGDTLRGICNRLVGLPERLRARIDPVLEGLRTGDEPIDPTGAYEDQFVMWCSDWHAGHRTAYAMSENLQPPKERWATRLRLCRNVAKDVMPELIEWFGSLRAEVCDGGHTAAWGWGDAVRDSRVPGGD